MNAHDIDTADAGDYRSPFALPAEGDIVAGTYEVRRRLGEGGMGVVYEGLHLRLHKRVALKFLHPQAMTSPDGIARFEREARAAGQLVSSNTVHVVDVATTDGGLPFLVMDLLCGRDLDAEMVARKNIPFTVREAVDIVLQACAAMREAHALGVIHRDLKPSNLFLAEQYEGCRVVKVLDFGISKVAFELDTRMTETCTALGTPLYMSPEQVRSAKHVDARTDIWSMGVILFELLAGEPPFSGDGTGIFAAIVEDPPPRLREKRPDVPAALEAVIERALKKRPDDRYRDVCQFAEALEPFSSLATLGRPRRLHPRSVRRTVSALGIAAALTPLVWLFGGCDALPVRMEPAVAQAGETPAAVTAASAASEAEPDGAGASRPPHRP